MAGKKINREKFLNYVGFYLLDTRWRKLNVIYIDGAKSKNPRRSEGSNFGGAKRDRTADLLHAMQALSQLSYSPTGPLYEPNPLGAEFGGAKRDRTADLLHAMQALSQLSYSPVT